MADSSSADNPLDQLRLSLMQDVLPVGLAVLERARQGGPTKVAEVFSGASADPIADLREEGEPAARTVREQLDQVSPGLGNPVMPVSVSVEEPVASPDERSELIIALQRIEGRLEELSRRLPADS
ncbi:hypothetical protein KR100_01065 [Synechococcus sp. KORDI-100]|uniref:hypothetical protein n=1 Tax=Synechococcus sp. KORDI-100 TaxID=1280380 RepID=UPI0004E06C0F|nr:hypothetical protein [Synechococcus sp. KORDI-100]AII41996.1 hypothetical protein KR100_01065 [Synechococcus sp. KORDI-100]